MLAHHTVGGCNFNTGDLIGSGTISGTERGSFGSLSWFVGKQPCIVGPEPWVLRIPMLHSSLDVVAIVDAKQLVVAEWLSQNQIST